MSGDELNRRLRALPSVDRVVDALGDEGPHEALVEIARMAIEQARADMRAGGSPPAFDDVVGAARSALERARRARLTPVLNATGVLVHTNLGRVPLGGAQRAAMNTVAGSYSNLEYDLEQGRRGTRYGHARESLARLTGAETALAVNNNAAAVLVTLAALCAGREVIISRGELIEIGGEFRIPDVMAASGARLVEVGTTNRTHLGDYERAITAETAAILKVHPSNYRVVGFTKTVSSRDLARLARGRGVLFLHDLGSGLVHEAPPPAFADEPLVRGVVEEGADVVMFSGDKLLGGPQAGIIAGRTRHIDAIARHPLLRAIRVDKITLAALQATLDLHASGRAAELPLWRMASAAPEELENRARALAARLEAALPGGFKVGIVPVASVAGGGSLPGGELPSWAVAVDAPDVGASEVQRRLRGADPPIVARVDDDRTLLDVRTIAPEDDELLARAAASALAT